MFSDSERLQRCIAVLQDAFDGHPDYMEKDVHGFARTWIGDDPKHNIDFTVGLTDATTVLQVKLPDGAIRDDVFTTYNEFARWVYEFSREISGQDWLSPRHFVQLINDIFEPDPLVLHNSNWPHRIQFRPFTENPETLLIAEWHEEECKLTATIYYEHKQVDQIHFHKAGEAIGWLTALYQQGGS